MAVKTQTKREVEEVSAVDVADYFVSLSYKDEEIDENVHEGITNLKLQKLLYFSQAAHLALHDEKLFEEDVEAWKYGPVIRNVYGKYKKYGNKPIPLTKTKVKLDERTQYFLDGIWELLDKYSAGELMYITHQHKPWKDAYQEGENIVITPKAMQEYYKGVFELQDGISQK